MKIVFMGTPDFAVPTLQALYNSEHEVCAVFTQPDKPTGRGYKMKASPVKELALQHGTPVHQPESLKKAPDIAVEILSRYQPDLIIVAAYGKILPKEVLEFPKFGCINVHGSLLPKYRGAAPIQRSVLNGDRVTGITVMQMGEGLDTGDILLQSETDIGINETSAELFDRLSQMGAQLMVDALERLSELTPIPQNDELSSYAPMLSKDMCEIDFTKDAYTVNKHICGLSDWPCAVTSVRGKRIKVYKSELVSEDEIQGAPGQLINAEKFIVACGKGSVRFVVVQAEGAKRMSSEDFVRGRHLTDGEMIGNM